MAKAFHPGLVSANHLATGRVIYRAASGAWVAEPGRAEFIADPETAEARLAAAAAEPQIAVGPYLAPARVGEVGARKLVGVGDCTGDGRPDLMLNQLIGGGLLMAAVSSTFVSVGRLRGDTVYCGDVDHDGVGDMIEVARGALFLVTSGDPT